MPKELDTPLPSKFEELSKISGEICGRLSEMDVIKKGSAARLVHRLSSLAKSPTVFEVALGLMQQNDRLLSSFGDLGKNGLSGASLGIWTKQAIHQDIKRELEAIEPIFPEVAQLIRATREQITRHEEASASHDLDRSGRKRTLNFGPVVSGE